MSNEKYSPAPWKACGNYVEIKGRELTVNFSGDFNEYDLKLIAISPDMADILRDMIMELRSYETTCKWYMLDKAEQLLNKLK